MTEEITRNWGSIRRKFPRAVKVTRPTIETMATDCLDARHLRRAGFLDLERTVALRPFLRWPSIDRMRVQPYLIELQLYGHAQQHLVRVSWTTCHLGGRRPWLHCPHCAQRVAKLYRGLAGYTCRSCIGKPIYASQAKSAQSRPHFQACKLRLRLGGSAALHDPIPDRPPRMRHRTYAILRSRLEALEASISRRVRAKAPDYPNLICYIPDKDGMQLI